MPPPVLSRIPPPPPAAAALTELGGDDRDVVPGAVLSVQLPEDEHGAVAGVDVEHSVHVCAPIDRVPAGTHTGTLCLSLGPGGLFGSVFQSPGEGRGKQSGPFLISDNKLVLAPGCGSVSEFFSEPR